MNIFEIFILSLGLAMDAFAVSVGLGLSMTKANLRKVLIVGGYFGVFQGVMPVIGYFAAVFFAAYFIQYSHFVSFSLLVLLGGKMIIDSFKQSDEETADSLAPRIMIPFAIATSIDAMAVGVLFVAMELNILLAVIMIGIVTFFISAIGVKAGEIFGSKYKSKATLAGGIILILIGLNIFRRGF